MRRTFLSLSLVAIALVAGGIGRPAMAQQPPGPSNNPGTPPAAAPAPQPAEDEYRVAYQLYAAERPDYARALDAARRATQAGNLSAAFLLGVMYEKGAGVEANVAEARKWFERAASGGERAALFNLGMVALEQHDAGAAAAVFRTAAEKGLAPAQAAYGRLLDSGQGVDRDEKEALKWYRMAAEGGDVVGAYQYGSALLRGAEGTEKDPAEAARWFQSAAGQNVGVAQLALGLLYADGNGVAKDQNAAADWFKKASDAGVPEGMYQYAVAINRGLGTAKNAPEAFKIYRRLADWAHPGAMQGLAALYFSGEGTAPNTQLAYYWAALSLKYYPANDPHRPAAAELKTTIEKNLSMGEKINLDVRGATFKPKPAPPLLAPFALLPPPAPVSRGPAPRNETVRAAPSAPSSGGSSGAVGSFGPPLGAGATLPRRGSDEAGVAPLDPNAVPVTTTGTPRAADFPTNDEAGVAPLDPSNMPVQPGPRRSAPNVPNDYLRFDN